VARNPMGQAWPRCANRQTDRQTPWPGVALGDSGTVHGRADFRDRALCGGALPCARQVHRAFEYAQKVAELEALDVRYEVSVRRTDSSEKRRGVYLREPQDAIAQSTFIVEVAPKLHEVGAPGSWKDRPLKLTGWLLGSGALLPSLRAVDIAGEQPRRFLPFCLVRLCRRRSACL
jgi:hypothetical protein